MLRVIGPFKNLDFTSIFFFIKKPALPVNWIVLPSSYFSSLLDRTISDLQMSPFILYLYLKPLYSILGGSTIRAEPLTKKPIFVTFLWNPL